ncbi:hypothetical protein D3C71_25680 [compost metagenome]
MKAGDVVFGAFATKNGTLADHHSVVVQVSGDNALLVYTTSIKPDEPQARRMLSREFTQNERELANWPNRCRYDATQLAIVPVSLLTITGRVPTAVVQELTKAIGDAKRDGRLELNHFNPKAPAKATGYASRLKREAALR